MGRRRVADEARPGDEVAQVRASPQGLRPSLRVARQRLPGLAPLADSEALL
jgi:hypothetical protein